MLYQNYFHFCNDKCQDQYQEPVYFIQIIFNNNNNNNKKKTKFKKKQLPIVQKHDANLLLFSI